MTTSGPAKDSARRHRDDDAWITLAQRPDLPARVRTLLDGLLEQACAYFEPAVLRTLDEVEHELFRLAERSGNSAQQHEYFAALREIKLARADVAPRFLQHVESVLARIRLAQAARPAAPAAVPPPLSLVETSVLEEDLAQQEVAGRSEVRHSLVLYELAQRVAVLAGTPAWGTDALPLGPAQLAAAFRVALQDTGLGAEHRVLAFRQFDRMTMLPIGAFYEQANNWLIAQRVLPNLRPSPGFRRGAGGAVAAAATTEAAPVTSAAERAEADATTAPPAASADAADSELFHTLRQLLGDRRGHAPRTGADPASHASRDDLQSVLGALQRNGPSATRPQYDSEHFRNTLLVKLRRAGPAGQPLTLADEDADTVDLVGMLFDYITRNVREGSGARTLLTRLHVPVLRAALGDKTFFTRRDHPARELLNTIAETGARWIDDDDDADPDLARKMQLVVDHVGANFDGDLAVFENLLGDLSRHMQQLARRAEVVERRHVDAARGRDRLEVARRTAQEAIERALRAGAPLPRVRALLERAWTDALALSALRHGENSEEFQQRVAIAEQLVRRGATPLSATDEDAALRRELDAGLRQVGLHEDDARGVLDHLLPPDSPAGPAAADEQQRIDDALAARTPLGGEAEAPAPTMANAAPTPLTPAESEMLERLHKTAFGTWFDFVQNQQGLTTRRKLAWFSPVTGRCLFVNQRGARSEDRTLDQLARDLVRGQVRLVVDEQSSLIDRAWKAIVEILRPRAADTADGAPP